MIRKDKFIITILTIICIVFGVVIAIQATTNKRQKMHIQDAEELIEWQHEMIDKLGSLDAIRCSISFDINNKAVFGSIKNGDMQQVADATLHYLRKELIQEKNDTICNLQ